MKGEQTKVSPSMVYQRRPVNSTANVMFLSVHWLEMLRLSVLGKSTKSVTVFSGRDNHFGLN